MLFRAAKFESPIKTNMAGTRIENLLQRLEVVEEANSVLNLRVTSLEGQNIRSQNELSDLKSQVEDLTYRSMRFNLLFHELEEKRDENLKAAIRNFLTNNMKIPAAKMSKDNKPSDINIDIAHRLGKYQAGKNRVVVASFTTKSAVDLIKTHGKHLKGSPFRVTEQLPREMRARRIAQVPKLLELREKAPDAKTVMVRDKLLHDGKTIPTPFTKNPLDIIPGNPEVMSYQDDIKHTDTMEEKKSRFQGHCAEVTSLPHVRAAIDAMYQDGQSASATHIIYAYRIRDPASNMTVSGHSDNGEWGAASLLAGVLERQHLDNVFVAVTRKYGGEDMGQRRFTIISEMGEKAVGLLDS